MKLSWINFWKLWVFVAAENLFLVILINFWDFRRSLHCHVFALGTLFLPFMHRKSSATLKVFTCDRFVPWWRSFTVLLCHVGTIAVIRVVPAIFLEIISLFLYRTDPEPCPSWRPHLLKITWMRVSVRQTFARLPAHKHEQLKKKNNTREKDGWNGVGMKYGNQPPRQVLRLLVVPCQFVYDKPQQSQSVDTLVQVESVQERKPPFGWILRNIFATFRRIFILVAVIIHVVVKWSLCPRRL